MVRLINYKYVGISFFLGTLFSLHACKSVKKKVNPVTKTVVVANQPTINIQPNQKIISPLKITVNSKGFWLASEGELGTVTLFDAQNNIITSGILTSADGNWMTSADAHFLSTLTFEGNGKKEGKLIFKNRLVRKNDVEKTIEIPIQF